MLLTGYYGIQDGASVTLLCWLYLAEVDTLSITLLMNLNFRMTHLRNSRIYLKDTRQVIQPKQFLPQITSMCKPLLKLKFRRDIRIMEMKTKKLIKQQCKLNYNAKQMNKILASLVSLFAPVVKFYQFILVNDDIITMLHYSNLPIQYRTRSILNNTV